ncbi:MAG: ATP-binding protein [Paucibacter sp.]|nr:ATP-binding protein [Roseateles sp.]
MNGTKSVSWVTIGAKNETNGSFGVTAHIEHFSEVLKILDGALKANASMAANYAGLLADKLERDGQRQQARLVRERLARAPAALAHAQDASAGGPPGLPVDADSRLHTVDLSRPNTRDVHLQLPTAISTRANEFLQSIQHRDQLARVGAAMPNRMLLYGPPGTGKTQTARWLTAQLAVPLLTVRCDTLISSLLGQTSRNLRRVFEHAQQQPCVLFLDEFDALASARGNERDVGELQRIVIALLQNIDALPEDTILIASTNHEQLLDPAIWRRFPFRVPLPMPDLALRQQLWRQFLGELAPPKVDWAVLAERSAGASGALIEQVCLDAKRVAVLAGKPLADESEVFRRLSLAMALASGVRLSSLDDEIRWLRQWDPKRFSLRVLADAYQTTTRHVTNAVCEGEPHGNKKAKGTTR